MTVIRTLLGVSYTDDGVKLRHRGPGPKRELCIMACVFCRDAFFKEWVRRSHRPIGSTVTEADAKDFILTACGIESRNELDTNSEAAERFHALVRVPFLAWKEAQLCAR